MRPTPIQWLFGSKYTLPIWIGLGLWLWFSQGGRWENFTENQKISFVIIGVVFLLFFLKSFPTVFFYEREVARYKRSSMSPEERWQRATVSQTLILVLVAIALLYFGFSWWKSTPEPQPASYKAAVGFGGVSLLTGAAYLKVRTWRTPTPTEQPAIVTWCVPIPKQSAANQPLPLPDYCKKVMLAGEMRSPAASPLIHPAVNS